MNQKCNLLLFEAFRVIGNTLCFIEISNNSEVINPKSL